MKIKRIAWQNDKPASEKQIAFVESLVYKIKAQRPPASAVHADDRMMWELWEYAEVSQDLTKSEASTLIDLLRYCQWNSITFAMDLATALLKRIECGALTLGTDKHLCMLAISDCQPILDGIMPDKINAAQMIAKERKERKATT